jgi:hypothetical protein
MTRYGGGIFNGETFSGLFAPPTIVVRIWRERVKQLEREFSNQPNIQEEIGLLAATSSREIGELRGQIQELRHQVETNRSIVKVQKIDPVLEATLKVSVENLARRLDAIEKEKLTKWDVAKVFIALLGVVGVVASVLKLLLK